MRYLFLLLIIISTLFCSNTKKKEVIDKKIKEGEKVTVKIIERNYMKLYYTNDERLKGLYGSVAGFDQKNGLIFITKLVSDKKDHKEILILNINKNIHAKSLFIKEGPGKSPDMIRNLHLVSKENDVTCISDANFKVMFFDKDYKWMSSNMLRPRGHLDIFRFNNSYYLLQEFMKFLPSSIKRQIFIYKVFPHDTSKRAEKILTLFEPLIKQYKKTTRKDFNQMAIWAHAYSMEMDEKIIYGDNREKCIYEYDFKKSIKRRVELPFLKQAEFTEEDLKEYNQKYYPPAGTQMLKKRGYKFNYKPYSGSLFYHGLIDGGENIIGIVSHLEIKKKTMTIDFFNIEQDYKYVYTISLPMNYTICSNTYLIGSDYKLYLSITKGYLVYTEVNDNFERFPVLLHLNN